MHPSKTVPAHKLGIARSLRDQAEAAAAKAARPKRKRKALVDRLKADGKAAGRAR